MCQFLFGTNLSNDDDGPVRSRPRTQHGTVLFQGGVQRNGLPDIVAEDGKIGAGKTQDRQEGKIEDRHEAPCEGDIQCLCVFILERDEVGDNPILISTLFCSYAIYLVAVVTGQADFMILKLLKSGSGQIHCHKAQWANRR